METFLKELWSFTFVTVTGAAYGSLIDRVIVPWLP